MDVFWGSDMYSMGTIVNIIILYFLTSSERRLKIFPPHTPTMHTQTRGYCKVIGILIVVTFHDVYVGQNHIVHLK